MTATTGDIQPRTRTEPDPITAVELTDDHIDMICGEQTLSCETTVTGLGSILTGLDERWSAMDARTHRGLIWCVVGAIGLLLCGTYIAASWDSLQQNRMWGSFMDIMYALAAIASIAAVSYGIAHIQLEARPNQFRLKTLEQLHRLLATDMKPDSPIQIYVNRLHHDSMEHLVRRGKVGPWDVDYYSNPWLRLHFRLLDGTRVSLAVAVHHQARSKTTRSQSGKIKHKRKTKTSQTIAIRLKYSAKKYPLAANIRIRMWHESLERSGWKTSNAGLSDDGHSGNIELKQCQVDGNEVRIKAVRRFDFLRRVDFEYENVNNTVAMLLTPLLGCYQVLNLAKAVERGKVKLSTAAEPDQPVDDLDTAKSGPEWTRVDRLGIYLPANDGKEPRIGQVIATSSADREGIEPGDTIVRIDGKKVANTREVKRIAVRSRKGKRVNLQLKRDGRDFSVTIELS